MAAPIESEIEGGESGRNNLIIRHLPSSMNAAEKKDLLRYFGAVHVRILSNFGRMKHTAFATFRDHSTAAKALSRLHQLNILGRTLVVEYAKNHVTSLAESTASCTENRNRDNIDSTTNADNRDESSLAALQKTTSSGGTKGLQQKIGISPCHGIDFPLNPVLHYRYPTPTVSILTNIINSLASVPRFYTQVLHLMNKMNLPAPFGPVTPTPPLTEDTVHAPSTDNNQTVTAMDVSSSGEDESEIESDPEEKERTKKVRAALKRPSKTKTSHQPKRHKLQPLVPSKAPLMGRATASSQLAKAVDVFEQAQAPAGKRIEFRLTEGIAGALDGGQAHAARDQTARPLEVRPGQTAVERPGLSSQVSGFGTFEHPPTEKETIPAKASLDDEEDEEEEEEGDEGKVTEFISRRELRNRLPEHEIKRHPVFKRYELGEPTTRLYLKNLAKTVEEKDLKYIYGRYVDWSSPIDRDMFTIQLMTQGRMKGQAFIGLPSEFAAQKALRDTNAYILQGKPIVVQFARSAKLKDKEEKTPGKKGRREI